MFSNILLLHKVSVWIFLLFFFTKSFLLLSGKKNALASFTRIFKVPDMIVSTLFLLSGIYLWTQSGSTGSWLYVKTLLVLASIPLAVIGFKKSNKILVVVSMLMLLVVYRMSETKSLSFKKPEIVISDAKDAPAIYSQYCVSCHGTDGRLGKSGAPDLTTSTLDEQAALQKISDGSKIMPAFGKVLSSEQLSQLSAYVEQLKAAK